MAERLGDGEWTFEVEENWAKAQFSDAAATDCSTPWDQASSRWPGHPHAQ